MTDITIDKGYLPCRRCGKNMRDPKTGAATIALSIKLIDRQEDPDMSEFLQKQMGDLVIGEDYSFCFECLIKAIWFSGRDMII